MGTVVKDKDAAAPQIPEKLYETRQPFDLTDDLQARVEALDLCDTIDHIEEEGYAYLHDAAPLEFTQRLRATICRIAEENKGVRANNMLLDKDPIFEEVVLNPKILAIAEVMCGKGAMLSQLVASVKTQNTPPLGLHADQNWMPAPFPVHNGLVTFCWACDEYTKEGGATKVIPKSHLHRRHPDAQEIEECKGAIAAECPAGTIPFWDGSVWHGNFERTIPGERVVLHITFSRLALRPVECYDYLGEDWLEGKPDEMRVLLGREDFLSTHGLAFSDPAKLVRTFNWAKQ
jgi:ectoine hydroxylase-related dioxygenase (phytanoyl-CoA dioxygenase family)